MISKTISKWTLLAAVSAMPTMAQAQDGAEADPSVKVEEVAPTLAIELPQDADAEAEAPRMMMWTQAQAQALYDFVENIGAEGLDPADYPMARLLYGLQSNNELVLSSAANQMFDYVANDVMLGHTPRDARIDWHIPDPDLNGENRAEVRAAALAAPDMMGWLKAQLPTHPQYAALRHALEVADPADKALVDKIRLNMDRWRWLPRDLGDRYIIVNVPAYTAALVEDGQTVSRHRAVAGAVKTPTPQLMAEATGVIFNPYWNVPQSIEGEVRGKAGYEAVKDADGNVVRWRQPPGPSNALGRVKFVMYNPHIIYLHDTNARGLFDNQARAYSHGCIRTENILKLATMLLEEDEGEWSPEKTAEVVNSGENTQANFVNPLPVYIVYMSAAAKPSGEIVEYKDIYSRDNAVLASLEDADRLGGVEEALAGGAR